MKVIFCRGIQASGKTTWSKNWALQDPTHRVRISWDDIRNMFGKYWVPARESLVKKVSLDMLSAAIEQNYDVVIDNMNLSEASTKDFLAMLAEKNIVFSYQDFKTPLDLCIERDSQREQCIGEEVIRSTYRKYKEFYD